MQIIFYVVEQNFNFQFQYNQLETWEIGVTAQISWGSPAYKSGQKMGRGNFEDFYFIITPNSTLEQSWSLARFSPNLKISVH